MAGLTDNGFEAKTLQRCRDDIEARLKAPSPDGLGPTVDTGSNSVLGILVGLFAYFLSMLWSAAQSLYSAFTSEASGAALDNVCALTGVRREEAQAARGYVRLYGTDGVVIAAGCVVSKSTTGDRFATVDDAEIGNISSIATTISCNAATTINYAPGYVAGVGSIVVAAITGIHEDCYIRLDAGGAHDETIKVASVTGFTVYLATNTTKAHATAESVSVVNYQSGVNYINTASATLLAIGDVVTFDFGGANEESKKIVTISGNVLGLDTATANVHAHGETVRVYGVDVLVEAEETGLLSVSAANIDTVVSSVVGLDAVCNVSTLPAFDNGSDIETDQNLRLRRQQSLQAGGSGPDYSIRAHILGDVDAVDSCLVVSNRTMTTDAVTDQPAKSFWPIVYASGGLSSAEELEVFEAIWRNYPAGIEAWGGRRSVNVAIDADAIGGESYTVTINGVAFTYVAVGAKTKAEIVSGLETLIVAAISWATVVNNGNDFDFVSDAGYGGYIVSITEASGAAMTLTDDTVHKYGVVTDEYGYEHIVGFQYVVPVRMAANIVLTHTSAFSHSTGDAVVKAAIVALSTDYVLGDDVAAAKILGVIGDIEGITDVQLQIKRFSGLPFGVWPVDSTTVAIDVHEIATFDTGDITIS